ATTPSGMVTFNDAGMTLGTSTLSTTAGVSTASVSTAALALGSHQITAVYAGDANCTTSTSALTQILNAVSAGTTLASSQNPSTVGQPVTFTASVSCPGFTPAGTVTFTDGATTLGIGTLSTTAGVTSASVTTSNLAAGNHPVTASFSGGANCAASTSAVLIQVVNVAVTSSITLVSSQNPSTIGQPVTFTASVVCAGTAAIGTVTFNDGTTTIGTGTLDTTLLSGNTSLTTSALAAGSRSITASYAGSANCPASSSAALIQVVNPAANTAGNTAAGQLPVFQRLPQLLALSVVTLTVKVNGCGTVNGNTPAQHQVGETVTLTAVPCSGNVLVSFSGGGAGCDGRTANPCVVVIPASDLTVTVTFGPAVSNIATQALSSGCNEVLTPAIFAANTPVVLVVQLVDGTVVVSIWRFDNARHVFAAGYFSTPGAPVDFTTTGPVQSLFLCVLGPGTYRSSGA
ncbi:MAG: Ig-like domain-containing protein, partial [Actinomycetota bacterium]|nr:Ig-like domain-containing protein [Actinomycetota bacterium]